MVQKLELFLAKQVGPVLDVRINRPQARIAITFAMERELAALELRHDGSGERITQL